MIRKNRNKNNNAKFENEKIVLPVEDNFTCPYLVYLNVFKILF